MVRQEIGIMPGRAEIREEEKKTAGEKESEAGLNDSAEENKQSEAGSDVSAGDMEQPEADACCCHKKKERSDEEYRDLIHRLNRIEGQIRGIRRMVENDAYCTDILMQVSAANAALNSFNKVLLASHIRTCVADDIRAGKDETVEELVNVLQKLMK